MPTEAGLAPAKTDLPAANWALVGPLLECPQCRSQSLEMARSDVVCTSCSRRFAIENNIIDFVGDQKTVTPPFYANRYYRTFMASLTKLHQAHYASGGFSDFIESSIKRDLFKLVGASPEPSVDLGCGLGEGFPLMGEESSIIGVDYEMGLLNETRRRYPKATLMRADFSNLPFRTGALKRVFAIAVLEHVFHLERAMEHMQRCLAPDGTFYVVIPTEGGLAVDAARVVTSTRNARIIGLTPAQSTIAQRKDHCNTVYTIENNIRKFFEIDASLAWPFRIGGVNINLSKAYRLKTLPQE